MPTARKAGMVAGMIARRRFCGIIILNLAAGLVIAGSLFDLFVPTVPANHLKYLGNADPRLDARLAELDLAMLRAIGGCLLAIGVACFVLINGPLRRGDGGARLAVLLLIGIAETNNAYRMYPFASPWYGPLSFAFLALLGTIVVGKSPTSESAFERNRRVPCP